MPRPSTQTPPRARRRGIYHPKPAPAESFADPDSLWAHLARFIAWQQGKLHSPHTIDSRARTLRAFAASANERGLMRPHDITKPILERWQRHLFLHRKADGSPLTPRSQIAHTEPLKAFFKWLAKENHILFNPASELELPRIGRRLPRTILTADEAEAIMAGVDVSTAMACAIGRFWRRCPRPACAARN